MCVRRRRYAVRASEVLRLPRGKLREHYQPHLANYVGINLIHQARVGLRADGQSVVRQLIGVSEQRVSADAEPTVVNDVEGAAHLEITGHGSLVVDGAEIVVKGCAAGDRQIAVDR